MISKYFSFNFPMKNVFDIKVTVKEIFFLHGFELMSCWVIKRTFLLYIRLLLETCPARFLPDEAHCSKSTQRGDMTFLCSARCYAWSFLIKSQFCVHKS